MYVHLLCIYNYLCSISIRYYKLSRDVLKYTGGCAQVIYKHSAILYEGLERLQILVSAGSWTQSPADAEDQL